VTTHDSRPVLVLGSTFAAFAAAAVASGVWSVR